MIWATLEIHLRGDVPDAFERLDALLVATRAFEGCLSVDVLVDQRDPQRVVVLERWASMERDAAYRAWRATPEGESGLGELVDAPVVLRRYDPR